MNILKIFFFPENLGEEGAGGGSYTNGKSWAAIKNADFIRLIADKKVDHCCTFVLKLEVTDGTVVAVAVVVFAVCGGYLLSGGRHFFIGTLEKERPGWAGEDGFMWKSMRGRRQGGGASKVFLE
jgi:hypothetical protein